jgi:DNA-binding LacI/PurR family transcriptional regulator
VILTQKKIADKLHISLMTVYRALQNKTNVSEDTRKKVFELVKKYDYRPDNIARSLVLKKTNTLGLILPCITHSFFPEIARAIEDVANARGYHVILCHTNRNCRKEEEEISLLKAKKVDGMIITPVETRRSSAVYQGLHKIGIPFVFIDLYIEGFDCNFVGTDGVSGAHQAVEHLIKLGHKRIAYISGPLSASTAQNRLEGYRQALVRGGIAVDENLIIRTEGFEYLDGRKAAVEFLEMEKRPTAIFAANDPMAIGCYQILQREGVRVPDEVSLVGFSGTREADLISLTTVVQPAPDIGTTAARILIEQIENKTTGYRKIFLKTELVIRRSTRAKRGDIRLEKDSESIVFAKKGIKITGANPAGRGVRS